MLGFRRIPKSEEWSISRVCWTFPSGARRLVLLGCDFKGLDHCRRAPLRAYRKASLRVSMMARHPKGSRRFGIGFQGWLNSTFNLSEGDFVPGFADGGFYEVKDESHRSKYTYQEDEHAWFKGKQDLTLLTANWGGYPRARANFT